MVNIIVEHEWKKENSDSVFKTVGNIVSMSKEGKLPEGFSLKSVEVLNDRNKAICKWEAPDPDSLDKLIGQVNPPTTHRVSEFQKIL